MEEKIQAICEERFGNIKLKETSNDNLFKAFADEIKSKISAKVVMWGVGIFLFLALAVVGFLWKNQIDVAKGLEAKQKAIIEKVDDIKSNLDFIRGKFDPVVKGSKTQPDKNSGRR